MPRLTSTAGCLCYDSLLKSDVKVQFTYVALGVNMVCTIHINVTLADMS